MTAIYMATRPFFSVSFVFVRERFGDRVVVCQVLLSELRGRAKAAGVQVLFRHVCVLIKDGRARVSIRISASPRIVRVSNGGQVPPTDVFLLTFNPIRIRSRRVLFQGDFRSQFTGAPYLRNPGQVQVGVIRGFVSDIAGNARVFQYVSEQLTFIGQVNHVGAIHSMRFLFFFRRIASSRYRWEVDQIRLYDPNGATPKELRLCLNVQMFFFRFAQGVTKRSLLGKLRPRFRLPISGLFSRGSVLIGPEFKR